MTKDLDKALKDYDPIYDRPVPVRYDVLHFDDEHRRLDALMRRHYSSFHPLVRDIFTSFSLEFSALLEKVKEMDKETEEIRQELEEKREIFENDLDDRVKELKAENERLESEIEEYQRKVNDLEDEIALKNQIIKEKDATIVTQRRQLDLYIEKDTISESEKLEKQKELHRSIESVNEFTNELEKIEKQMRELETEKLELEKENSALKSQLSETESQYMTEIEEINSLYSDLKKEFDVVLNRVQKLQQEKKELQSKVKNEASNNQVSELQNENARLRKKIEELHSSLEEKEHQLKKVKDKNERFKEVAGKIIEMKEKLEQQGPKKKEETEEKTDEKKVFHPADETRRTRKWSKQKSPLEAEIEEDEGEIESSSKLSQDEVTHYKGVQIVENDLELNQSVTKITSKLDRLEEENELVKSIRSPAMAKDGEDLFKNTSKLTENDISSILMEELGKSEDHNDEESTHEAKPSNLEKVLSRIEDDEMSSIGKFITDFPKPPDDDNKTSKRDNDEKEKRLS